MLQLRVNAAEVIATLHMLHRRGLICGEQMDQIRFTTSHGGIQ